MPPTPPTFDLRHNLKNLLKTERLSISELSRQTGITKQILSDWLAKTQPHNLPQVKLVATFFKLTIDDLYFNSNNQTNPKIVKHFSNHIEGRAFTIRIINSDREKLSDK